MSTGAALPSISPVDRRVPKKLVPIIGLSKGMARMDSDTQTEPVKWVRLSNRPRLGGRMATTGLASVWSSGASACTDTQGGPMHDRPLHHITAVITPRVTTGRGAECHKLKKKANATT